MAKRTDAPPPARLRVVGRGRMRHPVLLEIGALDRLDELVGRFAPGGDCALISDERVARALRSRLDAARARFSRRPPLIEIPSGEPHKNLDTTARVLDALVDAGVDREGVVIAVGGGVVTDLAGFAAAIHLRGVRHLLVPTSLLAQVDAAIGGKTGVDTARGKNLAGSFHAPAAVIVDPSALTTLPHEEWVNGFGEVLKYAVIEGGAFFEEIERTKNRPASRSTAAWAELVWRCIEVKARHVDRDPLDRGVRRRLNLGHTVGHALEAALGFRRLRHGEAVALGILAEARLAAAHGLARPEFAERIARAAGGLGLPLCFPSPPVAAVLERIRRDKKSVAGRLRFALPRAPGRVEVRSLPCDERLAAAVSSLADEP